MDEDPQLFAKQKLKELAKEKHKKAEAQAEARRAAARRSEARKRAKQKKTQEDVGDWLLGASLWAIIIVVGIFIAKCNT